MSLDALPVVANAVASRRQAKVCLRPLPSYGEDRASRPPSAPAPGPHIGGVGPACAGFPSRRLMRIAPRPFQLRVRRFLGKKRVLALSRRLRSASRLPNLDMSLSTLLGYAAVAQRRIYGLFATPESFRLTQNPLGADLLPQALVSVGNTPSPEGLSIVLAD
jgi:hypothetical protein